MLHTNLQLSDAKLCSDHMLDPVRARDVSNRPDRPGTVSKPVQQLTNQFTIPRCL
jgi:hypothetical protein